MGRDTAVEAFLARWLDQPGGAECSNSHLFFCELCALIDAPAPEPATPGGMGDYVFERAVKWRPREGAGVYGRIDLYKRGCFILEAKQSRPRTAWPTPRCETPDAISPRGRRLEGRGWDRLMSDARGQAEGYVGRLPPDHAAPPFLIVCDIGHVFEVYADFSGTGRAYTFFPDRQGYRLFLDDLRRPEARDFLKAIWTDPHSLNPARRRTRVTQKIARVLAGVTRDLENGGQDAGDVALFLMRCVFCMFAGSMGLLPQDDFLDLLDCCIADPRKFPPLMGDLWTKMNDPEAGGRYVAGLDAYVPYVGGRLFHAAKVIPLGREAVAALRQAAEHSWAEVEPSIFGALLEAALDPVERRRLGAHYTPRAYVERLVRLTVIEPLRQDWLEVLAGVQRLLETCASYSAKAQARAAQQARAKVRAFHGQLRRVRVLDPACGTGNFLYITLELIKTLELEVLETLVQLGEPELLAFETVDPHQFHGLELNPRAAVIAELVLWIGFLQLHYRHHSGHPAEPILHAFGTIRHADAVLTWDGAPLPKVQDGREVLPHPRQPDWPEADFIVGNPPFLGGKDLRARLGDLYAEALWTAHPHMNRSADLVMYWWDRAAELLTRPGSRLRRFGFVTTNSVTQTFQRKVVAGRLAGGAAIHLVYAVPDHPWTSATSDAAAVRIAMTVAEAGPGDGLRLELTGEAESEVEGPHLTFRRREGRINADLTIGADLTAVEPLLANAGLCSPGVKLHGAGFIVSPETAVELGLGRRPGLEDYIRPYRNGRDVVQRGREAMVIDLYPLPAETVRARFPEIYQHLQATVKPHRDRNRMAFRREHWWWFGATHEMYRSFTSGLPRYICTPETAKHRVFVFLPAEVRADNMLVNVGLSDAFSFGVLSSRTHTSWARAVGAVLEDRPRYTKSACFDPFPFPDPPISLRERIAAAADEIEATRAAVQAEHPDLSLTAIYNVVDGEGDRDLRRRSRAGILRELHDALDTDVLHAYGWPSDLSPPEQLAALAALNAERRREEGFGHVRWLRPDYQAMRHGGQTARVATAHASPAPAMAARERPAFPKPVDEQSRVVLAMLTRSPEPLDITTLAALFARPGRRLQAAVEAALVTLMQYGHVSRTPDGRYVVRRAA